MIKCITVTSPHKLEFTINTDLNLVFVTSFSNPANGLRQGDKIRFKDFSITLMELTATDDSTQIFRYISDKPLDVDLEFYNLDDEIFCYDNDA